MRGVKPPLVAAIADHLLQKKFCSWWLGQPDPLGAYPIAGPALRESWFEIVFAVFSGE
jgi:hypothetical protein